MIPEVQIPTALVDRVLAFSAIPEFYRGQAAEAAQVVGQLAAEYTRGRGFATDGTPGVTASSVIVMATARLLGNPEQTNRQIGNVTTRSFFDEWNRVEKKLLDTLRRNAR